MSVRSIAYTEECGRAPRTPFHSRPLIARHVSSSANPYPFPNNVNPTPYQIFHLPPTATRDQVKARYYDLVRIYHPDSPISRAVPPETAHSRFQAISAAYAVLTGKVQRMADADSAGTGDGLKSDYHSLSKAMWRARQRKRAELDIGWDDRWKDGMMLGAVVLSVGAFVWQTYSTRRQAMLESLGRQQPYTVQIGIRRPLKPSSKSDEELLAEPEPGSPERKP